MEGNVIVVGVDGAVVVQVITMVGVGHPPDVAIFGGDLGDRCTDHVLPVLHDGTVFVVLLAQRLHVCHDTGFAGINGFNFGHTRVCDDVRQVNAGHQAGLDSVIVLLVVDDLILQANTDFGKLLIELGDHGDLLPAGVLVVTVSGVHVAVLRPAQDGDHVQVLIVFLFGSLGVVSNCRRGTVRLCFLCFVLAAAGQCEDAEDHNHCQQKGQDSFFHIYPPFILLQAIFACIVILL